MPADRVGAATKSFNTVLVKQLASGATPAKAVEAAKRVLAAESAFPVSKAPQVTATKNVMAGGEQVTAKLQAVSGAKTPGGSKTFEKVVAGALNKGASMADAVKTAQLAVKTAESFAKADASPQSALANTNSARGAAATPLANASPQIQRSVATMLANGVLPGEAMKRAEQAEINSAAAARADAANPAVGLARGDASALKEQPAAGGFDKVLAVAMAKGVPVGEAIARAAETNALEQRAIEADAKSPLAGFSNGAAHIPKGSPDFDRAVANAIARGEKPSVAIASAERAAASVPPEVQSPTRAIASGKNVDALLKSEGDSRIFKRVLNKSLANGIGIEKAMAIARRAEEGNAFRFALPRAVVSSAASGPVKMTAEGGVPLPAWLKFDPKTRNFVAHNVPPGALPLKVVITAGGKESTVVVSEQGGGN
ncbi:MAG: hypothetical protein D4R74_13310 [Betaproteobacteria bacterium]|nr:MAG: hypothetical protein D4R74_13310 [Betaproteobacteria bacterium]